MRDTWSSQTQQNPGKISQTPNGLGEGEGEINICCCKAQTFGVVCYVTLLLWYTHLIGSLLGLNKWYGKALKNMLTYSKGTINVSDYYLGCNCEQNSPCSHGSHVLWRDVSDGVTSDMWRDGCSVRGWWALWRKMKQGREKGMLWCKFK